MTCRTAINQTMANRRAEFTRTVKLAAFDRAGGLCEACHAKLWPGHIEYDHVIACEQGGTGTLGNCQVLCSACHKTKTSGEDMPRITKTRAQRAGHVGAKAASKRPIAGSKASGWRHRLDGTWERRE
jgi:5-methylcytosine-specific restriction enzyme A